MAHLSSKHVLLAVAAVLCAAISSCKAQDAVQIVARAAICFDNHTVINNCLQQMGINNAVPAHGSGDHGHHGAASGLPDKILTRPNASAVLCGTPCFGHMMLTTDCVDGILSNFQGYSSGLMQGVRAIFQMSCGAGNGNGSSNSNGTTTGNAADPPTSQGAVKGNASSGKMARNVSGSATVSAANGAGDRLHVGILVWAAILVATQYWLLSVTNN